jgi:hypothetical protein
MDELELARQRRNAIRREQYALDGGKRREVNQRWKDAHREKVRAAGREYQRLLRQSDPDRAKAHSKKYRETHPEETKERSRSWYRKNNGAEYHRKWAAAKRISDPVLFMLRNAKNRAKELGREFSIERSDVVIPEICPVLGIPIEKGTGPFQPNSPSLDRIDSSLGYVKGNIAVISWRANCLKRDGTLDEFRKIVAYMESGEGIRFTKFEFLTGTMQCHRETPNH